MQYRHRTVTFKLALCLFLLTSLVLAPVYTDASENSPYIRQDSAPEPTDDTPAEPDDPYNEGGNVQDTMPPIDMPPLEQNFVTRSATENFDDADRNCALDVMLVLDGSGSISSGNFRTMKAFARDLASSFEMGEDAARFGLVQFSSSAVVHSRLETDFDIFNNRLSGMSQIDGDTDIATGISLGQSQLAIASENRVMVVLTDGQHNGAGDPIATANAAKANGTVIYGIGVGSADMGTVNAISSGTSFGINDFDQLAKILEELVDETCGLTIESVTLEERSVNAETWLPLNELGATLNRDAVVDGNIVKMTIEVKNESSSNQQVRLQVIDSNRSRPNQPVFLTGLMECNNQIDYDLPANETIEIVCMWNTSGFAWVDDLARMQQGIDIKLFSSQYPDIVADEESTQLQVLPKPIILVPGITTPAGWEGVYQGFLNQSHSDLWFAYEFRNLDASKLPGTNVPALADLVQVVRETQNAFQVDMLAHSTGGLIARAYANSSYMPVHRHIPWNANGNGPRPILHLAAVNKLMMMGTPNLGTTCHVNYEHLPDVARQLSPEFMKEFNNSTGANRYVDYIVLASAYTEFTCLFSNLIDFDPIDMLIAIIDDPKDLGNWGRFLDNFTRIMTALEIIYNIELYAPGDTFVSIYSAAGGFIDREVALVEHEDLISNGEVFATVRNRFALDPEAAQENAFTPISNTAQPEHINNEITYDGIPSWLHLETVTLAPGQVYEIDLPTPTTTILTATLTPNPDYDAALIDPNGVVVSEVLAGDLQANLASRVLSAANVIDGMWQLRLTSTSSEAIPLSIGAFIGPDPIDLYMEFDLTQVMPELRLSVNSNDIPVTNATVNATLQAADGTQTVITLMDNGQNADAASGDGIYGVEIDGVPAGSYTVYFDISTSGLARQAIEFIVLPDADLSITADVPSSSLNNDTLMFMIDVTNNGPTAAENVVLTHMLPAGVNFLSAETSGTTDCTFNGQMLTCPLDNISSFGDGQVLVTTQVTANPGTTLTSESTVTADTPDSTTGNNSVSVNIPVLTAAPNDNFAGATVIGALPYNNTQDTNLATAATTDPGQNCGWNVGRTVWYQYTAMADAPVAFSTAGSDYNTVLAVYTGDPANLTLVACDDDTTLTETSDVVVRAVTGTTYHVMVGGFSDAAGTLQFNAAIAPAPVNDEIVNAINVNALPFVDARQTLSATATGDPTFGCGSNVGVSVWYQHTATALATQFDTTGSDYDTVIAVFTGTPGSLTRVICDDDGGLRSAAQVRMLTTPGETYYVAVGGYDATGGDLLFTTTDITAAIPPNDEFDLGTAVTTLPFTDAQDTKLATSATDDPNTVCDLREEQSIWYRYTPVESGAVRFTTQGSEFDTVMAVFTGIRGDLDEVFCDDDNGPDNTSYIDMEVTGGQTYHIMIEGDNAQTGIVQFAIVDISYLLPPNDNFDNATILPTLPFTDTQDMTYTATAPDDPAVSCGGSTIRGSLWYTYTAPIDFTLVITTEGSTFDTVVGVYTGTRGNLNQIACDDNSGNGAASVVYTDLTSGQTYYIMARADSSSIGTLAISVSGQNQTYDPAVPVSPAQGDGLTNNYVRLQWLDDVNATAYNIGLDLPNGTFNQVWLEREDVCNGTICQTPAYSLDDGQYTWYVRAYGVAGMGSWSNPVTFYVGEAPPLAVNRLEPTNGTTITTLAETTDLRWEPLENGLWYYVYLEHETNGVILDGWYDASQVCVEIDCTLSDLIFVNGTYEWWMAAYGNAGVGPYNQTTFTVDLPAAGSIDQVTIDRSLGVSFSWEDDRNTAWYHSLVEDANGATIIDQWYERGDICSNGFCFVSSQVLPEGDYTLHIAGWGPGGISDYTSHEFTIRPSTGNPPDVIQVITPDNAANLNLQWYADANALWYNVYIVSASGVYLNEWFEGSAVCSNGLCTAPARTFWNGNYEWWIAGWGPGGVGEYSLLSFTINLNTPSVIQRIFPADGVSTVVGNVDFVWLESNEAIWYHIFINERYNGWTVTDQWVQATELCENGACLITVPVVADGDYEWWMGSWGPSGTGEYDMTRFEVIDQ